ncbi:hypothetical protein NPIL_489561 [Nephila pilipes]|uniref:Uncharacterized protein n=1 Tax=Nephila pilipes TaxID=299642 RepID=A0A8X6NQX7_NEPPI|nr:hypothetical protein NPIL_489561 [Nephila pilipes]
MKGRTAPKTAPDFIYHVNSPGKAGKEKTTTAVAGVASMASQTQYCQQCCDIARFPSSVSDKAAPVWVPEPG